MRARSYLWAATERFGFLLIQFGTNLFLARTLSPLDFGTMGIVLIFIALSLAFIDGGFGAAIVQKKTLKSSDIRTVFTINLGISVLLYLAVFLSSGYLAIYYQNDILKILLRISGLGLIVESLSLIQQNMLVRKMKFNKLTIIKVTAAFISCILAIAIAYNGFGVWALVVQHLSNSIVKSVLFWIISDEQVRLGFDTQSFRKMFSFGGKLLLSRLISDGYIQFQSAIIGRVFGVPQLGYYIQAKQLQQIPVQSLNTVINNVSFPIFSKLQESPGKLRLEVIKLLKIATYINFPMMILLALIAKPLFVTLYGETWIASVDSFRFLVLGFGLLLVVHGVNLNTLKSIGASSAILKLEVIKKIGGLLLMGLFIPILGYNGLFLALFINSVFELYLNARSLERYIDFGFYDVIHTVGKNFISSIISGMIVIILLKYVSSPIWTILVVIIYSISYLYLSRKSYEFSLLKKGIHIGLKGFLKIFK